jgi:hypothetical protein
MQKEQLEPTTRARVMRHNGSADEEISGAAD